MVVRCISRLSGAHAFQSGTKRWLRHRRAARRHGSGTGRCWRNRRRCRLALRRAISPLGWWLRHARELDVPVLGLGPYSTATLNRDRRAPFRVGSFCIDPVCPPARRVHLLVCILTALLDDVRCALVQVLDHSASGRLVHRCIGRAGTRGSWCIDHSRRTGLRGNHHEQDHTHAPNSSHPSIHLLRITSCRSAAWFRA